MLDAVEPARDERRDREVLVDVATGHAVLHAQAASVADDAQSAGAVVESPRHGGRCEAALDEALVGVDVGGEEQAELAQCRQLAGDPVLHELRESVGPILVGHDGLAVLAHDREVDVARVALALVVLGHEGQRLAVLVGDLLRPVLVDGVVVAGAERVRVAEGDLLLAEVALALDALAVHAGAIHAVADVAQQRLHAAGREQRVVDVVVAGRVEVDVLLLPGIPVAVLEDDELEFRAHERAEALLGQAVELALEDLPGVGCDGCAVEPGQVGRDECRARQPRHQAQGVDVRHHRHVAVAPLPAGDRVSAHGVHLDIDGEQVVAALGAVLGELLQEETSGCALADEAPLHVGEGDDDGVDLLGRDHHGQLLNSQVARLRLRARVCHWRSSPSSMCRPLHHEGCLDHWATVTRNLHPKVDTRYQ